MESLQHQDLLNFQQLYLKKDILITVKGTVGELAVNPYYKAHIARQIMAIRPYLVNNEFLKIYLETKIDNMKLQSQSMIPGISREVLLKLLIALPPKNRTIKNYKSN